MRKFALYYGVVRDTGDKEVIKFGNRGLINDLKEQCGKDFSNPKIATKYSALVLATDYGLKNCYKLAHPEAKKLAEDALKATEDAAKKAKKKADADAKKEELKAEKEAKKKADADAVAKELADEEQKEADARLEEAKKKAEN